MMSKLNYLLSMIQTDYVTVRVKFDESGRKYTYKCGDTTVKRDDYVVVVSDTGIPKVAQVCGVDTVPNIDPDSKFDYKWIAGKVDLEEYNARINGETAFYKAIEEAQHKKRKEDALQELLELGVSKDNVKMLQAEIFAPAEEDTRHNGQPDVEVE